MSLVAYEKSEDRSYLVVPRIEGSGKTAPCGYCGKTHTHGPFDGHRTPHCSTETKRFRSRIWLGDGTILKQSDGYVLRADLRSGDVVHADILEVVDLDGLQAEKIHDAIVDCLAGHVGLKGPGIDVAVHISPVERKLLVDAINWNYLHLRPQHAGRSDVLTWLWGRMCGLRGLPAISIRELGGRRATISIKSPDAPVLDDVKCALNQVDEDFFIDVIEENIEIRVAETQSSKVWRIANRLPGHLGLSRFWW